MQKEILTKEKCVMDIEVNETEKKYILLDNILYFIFAISVFASLVLFFITQSAMSLLLLLIPTAIIVFWICNGRAKKKKILPENIVIKELTCLKVVEDIPILEFNRYNNRLRQIMYLESCDRFIIPYQCYKWSKLYCMSDKTINMTSLEGDVFYVAFLKDNSDCPLAVYNKKFFEFDPFENFN